MFAAWGDPADDRDAIDGAFQFRFVRLGKLIVAVQPDRGDAPSRKGDYHNLNLPPRHAYVAFHFWLTRKEKVDAIIQLGAHGTLEWLPGKAVALSENCAPEVLLGATPVLYPFIVNNPGEAAQAKRRISAVTIGHLTPPLIAAGSYGATLELEGLFDEFAEAQALDPRRARAIAALILERGRRAGFSRNAPPMTSRQRRRSSPLTLGSATSRKCASAMACMCSAGRRRAPKASLLGKGGGACARPARREPHGAAGLELERRRATRGLSERVAACGAAEVARAVARAWGTVRAARPSWRAGARPSRRSADRPQPLCHRSTSGPDSERLGDRPACGRRDSQTLRAGPWRMAEAHCARPVGLGDHAHRRR